MNGGDTSIVASDDAVNASAADLSDSSDESEGANDNGAPGERGITVNGETPGKGGPAAGGSPVDGGSFPGGSKGGGNRGGAPGAGSSDCLIQVNGGTLVLDSVGDAIDSNGSVEITGGTVLVNGPSSDGDGAFDYDSEATVSGGTVLMIGSSRMAQSFSGGTQPFLCTANVSGSAGDTVAIVDANGNVIASITAAKQFGMVLASSPKFTEGGEYTLVIDGVLTNADAHGYTDSGTVTGGSSTSVTASTTPSSSVEAWDWGLAQSASRGNHSIAAPFPNFRQVGALVGSADLCFAARYPCFPWYAGPGIPPRRYAARRLGPLVVLVAKQKQLEGFFCLVVRRRREGLIQGRCVPNGRFSHLYHGGDIRPLRAEYSEPSKGRGEGVASH